MPEPENAPEPPAARAAGSGCSTRCASPPAGRSWSAVLLAVLGFAFVTQVSAFGVDDTYSGLPRSRR